VRTVTPAPVRFAAYVDTSGGPDACHPWTGGKTRQGYGGFHPTKGTTVLAHRFAWELENGPVPEGAHVDHVCHNGTGCPPGPCSHRLCCNVRHLDPTTPADNVDRSHNANAHKVRCPAGHRYTPENTYEQRPRKVGNRPLRKCRECARERDRARSPRRRRQPA